VRNTESERENRGKKNRETHRTTPSARPAPNSFVSAQRTVVLRPLQIMRPRSGLHHSAVVSTNQS
jgi:hypothetical protein